MITYKHHIFTQGSDIYMVTLDIDALLTNIQLDKTIDICVNKFFKNPEALVKKISKNDFPDLLNLGAMKKTSFGLVIVLYFLNHLNLASRFANICPVKIRT